MSFEFSKLTSVRYEGFSNLRLVSQVRDLETDSEMDPETDLCADGLTCFDKAVYKLQKSCSFASKQTSPSGQRSVSKWIFAPPD